MFTVQCPSCKAKLNVNDAMAGKSGKCPKCGNVIKLAPPAPAVSTNPQAFSGLPQPARQGPPPGQIPIVAPALQPDPAPVLAQVVPPALPPHTAQPANAAAPVSSLLAPFLNEEQDPTAVAQAYERVQQVVTRGEEILYIAVQKRPVVNLAPDCAVLTTRRFIIYRPKLLGRADFEDYIWRDLFDVRLKEGMMGATLTMHTVRRQVVTIDYLPKQQARILYRFAQEMEEKAVEERRARELEERRASAGGIVLQGVSQPATNASAPADDPLQTLKKLKEMADAGLITASEYEAKKSDILARM